MTAPTAPLEVPNASSGPLTPARARLQSVDVLRGIVMILMALDHVRDYFGDAAASPTNMATSTPALFLTRFVTHICAPTFMLLTGTGAYLALRRRTRPELARFLVSRGLWLVMIEWTVMRAFWQFNVDYHVTVLTVLWAIGLCMIALGALVLLPTTAVGIIGGAIVLLHNLLDNVTPPKSGTSAALWNVIHQPGFLRAGTAHDVFVAYPLIPWIGVMALGFSLGSVYTLTPERRRQILGRIGVAMLAAFVVLRALRTYGEPNPWSTQRSPAMTVMSFLNVTKYPPSLQFLLLTLGAALLILRALDGGTPRWLKPALIFGTVPFFYYLGHVLVMHVFAVIACAVRFGTIAPMFSSPTLGQYPITQPPGWPAPLPAVWLVWIIVVCAMYPLCRWFSALRKRRSDWWLSYL